MNTEINILENNPAIALLIDVLSGQIIYANQAALNFYGYSKDEILKKKIGEINVEGNTFSEREARNIYEGRITNSVYRHYTKDQLIKVVKASTSPVLIGQKKCNLAILEDVTLSYKIQKLYEWIIAIDDLIINYKEPDYIFSEFCKISVELGEFKFAWIGSVNRLTNTIVPVKCYGNGNDYLRSLSISTIANKDESNGPTGQAYLTGRYFCCNSIEKDPRMLPWRKEAIKYGYKSSIGVPIKIGDSIEFIVTLYAELENIFSDEQISNILRMTSNLEFALNKFQENEKRQLVEKRVNLLEKLLDKSPFFVGISDSKRNIIYWNKKMINFFGEDLYNRASFRIEDFYTPSALKIRHNAENHITKSDVWVGENEIKSINNTVIPIYQVLSKVVLDGIEYRFTIGVDISQFKYIEEAYKNLFEKNLDATFLTNPNGEIYDANPAACEMLGFTKGEICKNEGRHSIIFKEDPNLEKLLKERERKGKVTGVLKFVKKDGTIFNAYVSSTLFKDHNHENKAIVIAHDLSKMNIIEENIKKSEETFQNLINRINDGFISINNSFEIIYINRKAIEVLGLETKENYYTKNFINILRDAHFNLAARKIVKSAQIEIPSSIELFHDYGLNKWMKFQIYPSTNGITIIISDITRKKELENRLKKLRQNEDKLIAFYTIKAQEEERNLLGTELHDGVNQILAVTLLQLSSAQKDHSFFNESIEKSIEYINLAINENRKLAHNLTTPDFDISGKELRRLIYNFSETIQKSSNIKCHINIIKFEESAVTKDQNLDIYRIIQEQFSNILKHAHAKNIELTISVSNNILSMIIKDDGIGHQKSSKMKGIGLINIKRRVVKWKGNMKIKTSLNAGFELLIQMPIKK